MHVSTPHCPIHRSGAPSVANGISSAPSVKHRRRHSGGPAPCTRPSPRRARGRRGLLPDTGCAPAGWARDGNLGLYLFPRAPSLHMQRAPGDLPIGHALATMKKAAARAKLGILPRPKRRRSSALRSDHRRPVRGSVRGRREGAAASQPSRSQRGDCQRSLVIGNDLTVVLAPLGQLYFRILPLHQEAQSHGDVGLVAGHQHPLGHGVIASLYQFASCWCHITSSWRCCQVDFAGRPGMPAELAQRPGPPSGAEMHTGANRPA